MGCWLTIIHLLIQNFPQPWWYLILPMLCDQMKKHGRFPALASFNIIMILGYLRSGSISCSGFTIILVRRLASAHALFRLNNDASLRLVYATIKSRCGAMIVALGLCLSSATNPISQRYSTCPFTKAVRACRWLCTLQQYWPILKLYLETCYFLVAGTANSLSQKEKLWQFLHDHSIFGFSLVKDPCFTIYLFTCSGFAGCCAIWVLTHHFFHQLSSWILFHAFSR